VTALELLRQRAQVALETWIEQWAVGQPPPAVVMVSAAVEHEHWRGHTCHQLRDANGGLWIRANVADQARLTQCIFGFAPGVASREAIEEITAMAALARAEELRAALFGESPLPAPESVTQPPAELCAFGSGAVQIVCSPFGLRAIVDASVWRALLDDVLGK
jgi:hypothetical protein